MRPIDRRNLSRHEAKRCRAVAKGQHWEAWEESILWWSPDHERWQPLEAESLPHRRRWLIVETDEGLEVALLWEIGEGLEPLPPPQREDRAEEHPGELAEVH